MNAPKSLVINGTRKRVIVLGAGMSGLVAATELKQAGHDVIVLEARTRPGGRVYTQRDGEGRPIAEAGAGRIPESHTWTSSYIQRLGLATEPLYGGVLKPLVYARGRRIAVGALDDLAAHFDLTVREKQLGYNGLVEKYLMSGVQRVLASNALHHPEWPPESLRDLDRCTVREDLTKKGLSETAIDLLMIGAFPDRLSPLLLSRVFATYDRTRLRRISKGNDALPLALAARLETEVLLGSKVTAVRQRSDGVAVSFERIGEQQELTADAVICTLPLPVLGSVEFWPPLTSAKQEIAKNLVYTKVVKLAIRTKTRYWEKEGLSGFAQLDTAAEIWSPRWENQDASGVLQFYQQGNRAEELDAMDENTRRQHCIEAMERVFPGLRSNIETVVEHSWQSDPWARGAYGIPSAGDAYRWRGAIAQAEGRIHFAGEHTSEYPAWIEGAIRSGYRAAAEVHASV